MVESVHVIMAPPQETREQTGQQVCPFPPLAWQTESQSTKADVLSVHCRRNQQGIPTNAR